MNKGAPCGWLRARQAQKARQAQQGLLLGDEACTMTKGRAHHSDPFAVPNLAWKQKKKKSVIQESKQCTTARICTTKIVVVLVLLLTYSITHD